MKNKRTRQIMIIAICIVIAVLGGILQIRNLQNAEPVTFSDFFSEEVK